MTTDLSPAAEAPKGAIVTLLQTIVAAIWPRAGAAWAALWGGIANNAVPAAVQLFVAAGVLLGAHYFEILPTRAYVDQRAESVAKEGDTSVAELTARANRADANGAYELRTLEARLSELQARIATLEAARKAKR